MKKRISVLLMVAILLVLTAVAGAQDGIIKDTVLFDKAYIPALFLTGQGKLEQSQLAMQYLKEAWAEYKKKYAEAQPTDTQWVKDMDKVEDFIMAADKIVANGKDLLKSHEELEGVRLTMMEARKRNKIDYLPDYLTVFHGDMEEMFDAADKKTPDTISETNIQIITKVLPRAMATWASIKGAKVDSALFGFSLEQVQKYNSLHEAEENALLALQGALEKRDRAGVIKYAISLKGKFVPLYLLFGDFERLKK
jgi:hypothetical protein